MAYVLHRLPAVANIIMAQEYLDFAQQVRSSHDRANKQAEMDGSPALGAKAQYKVSRSCFSQRQVVDYARATCFYSTSALSGCQLAEATASLSQLFVQAFPSESTFKQTRLLPTDKAQPSRDF